MYFESNGSTVVRQLLFCVKLMPSFSLGYMPMLIILRVYYLPPDSANAQMMLMCLSTTYVLYACVGQCKDSCRHLLYV